LGVLETEQLIVREPGRGTFARSSQTGRACGRFNPIRDSDGAPLRGQIQTGKAKLGTPEAWEQTGLKLEAGEQVVRFERLRSHEGRPFAYELLCLPGRTFPDLATRSAIPDDLEELAQDAGVLVAWAQGKVRAMPVPPAAATALALPEGTVVLCLERLALDTDGQPVELMIAYYDLRNEYCRLVMR
jgi:GntR family transcriptional regulator